MLTDKGWKDIELKEPRSLKCPLCKGGVHWEEFHGFVSEEAERVILCWDHYFTSNIKGILKWEFHLKGQKKCESQKLKQVYSQDEVVEEFEWDFSENMLWTYLLKPVDGQQEEIKIVKISDKVYFNQHTVENYSLTYLKYLFVCQFDTLEFP